MTRPSLRSRSVILLKGLALLVVLVLAVFLRVHFIQVSLSNYDANADEVLSFLQAQAISRGSRPLFFWTQPYQFPFESYILSHFAPVLPWNTFGLRIVQLSLCLLAVPGFLLIYTRLNENKLTPAVVWPGVALILFPSSYWLLRQVGLMTPQHAMTVTFTWMLPLIVAIALKSQVAHRWALAGGLCSGMALSNHLLILSIVLPAAIVLCLGKNFRQALRNTCWFVPGFLIGLAPYIYAKCFVPGAYQRVSDTVPISRAFSRLWDPVLSRHIPTALGVDAWIFPDHHERITDFVFLVQPTAYLFCGLLIALTLIRSLKLVQRLRIYKWPMLGLPDVFLGATWLALILLCLTGMELRTRYALPVIWCFPFLVSYAYTLSHRVIRFFLAVVVVVMVAVNISHSVTLLRIWKTPNFSAEKGLLPDLQPVYDFLAREGASHCYAGWWDSYRIIFDSKERIICSPPFNDRFAGWQQPYYRELVERSDKAPYIAGVYLHRLLRKERFIPYLAAHEIIARRKLGGAYTLYRQFQHKDVAQSRVLRDGVKAVSTSSNAADANTLVDGRLSTTWRSTEPQQKGMSILLDLEDTTAIHFVRMYSEEDVYLEDPPRVDVEVKRPDGQWQLVKEDIVGHPYPLKLDPTLTREYYPGLQLMIGFPEIEATSIRLRIRQPREGKHWHLAEIQLFTRGEDRAL